MQSSSLALRMILVCHLTATCAAAAEPVAPQAIGPFDLLVIAPHSDDEAIGCTGAILRAVAKKQRVGIVVVTAGDGFPKAAAAAAKKPTEQLTPRDYLDLAALRQRHTLAAMPELGVPATDILFLGYPDGGMKTIYQATDEQPYRQPYTQKTETYGIVASDYHSRRHGRPAPYRKSAVVDDLAEIIREGRPREIYVTHEVDTHPDHGAVFEFVRDAALAARFGGPLLTFVVHGEGPAVESTRQITLTAGELKRKRATLEIYQAGVSPVHDRLAEEYARPEEEFWEERLPARAAP